MTTPRPAMPTARGINIPIDEIVVPDNSRPYNATAVSDLSRSIAAIGLQSAPTVVERDGKYRLIARRHRLEAMRLLGHDSIFARLVTFDDAQARLWTISENLYRAELTVAQRAAQISEYAELVKERGETEASVQIGQKLPGGGADNGNSLAARSLQSAQVAQFESRRDDGRGHRAKGGDSLAARELGISRDEVRRSQQIASLSAEAKQAAQDFDLEDNQSALLAASKAKTADSQVAVLTDIADRGRVAGGQPARSLRNLENISGGELARWIKQTTPNDRRHVIRVLETAAAILANELNEGGTPDDRLSA